MSTGPSYLDRKNSGIARSGVTQALGPQAGPQTPRRNPPSTYSSPGTGLRAEDDYVVVDLGARHISLGFAGESSPKCTLGFSQEESRRVGDYRRWLPAYAVSTVLLSESYAWGRENELWSMDLRDADLGLIEDKFERAIREAYSRFLLQDSKSKRLMLALPSILPHAILASVVSILFRNFQPPSITLLPIPTVTVLTAGQRAGLVVDIGWHETVVTAVYEFREIRHARTTRAMKHVTLAMARLVDQVSKQTPTDLEPPAEDNPKVQFDFEFAEEVTSRLAWCRSEPIAEKDTKPASHIDSKLQAVSIGDDTNTDDDRKSKNTMNTIVKLPRGPGQKEDLGIRFNDFSLPVESALFGASALDRALDDEEHTVHQLIYELLTALQPDLRAVCMANVIFTGGGSQIPGLKSRLMSELSRLVESRGWDPVWGGSADKHRERLKEIDQNRRVDIPTQKNGVKKRAETTSEGDSDEDPTPPAYAEPLRDEIYEKIRQTASKTSVEEKAGALRCIESLGVWEGASMAASLKIKGVVEIDRELYMQHGLLGAQETENNAARSRQSMGAGLGRPVAGDRDDVAWTLGIWALNR